MKKIIRFVSNRTFWIQAASAVALIGNEMMPIVPKEYIIYANIGLTLLNRYLKAAKEVK
jgi:hypothetical protein